MTSALAAGVYLTNGTSLVKALAAERSPRSTDLAAAVGRDGGQVRCPRDRLDARRGCSESQLSDSGSGMGAAVSRQARSDAACWADGRLLTCADAREQGLRTPE